MTRRDLCSYGNTVRSVCVCVCVGGGGLTKLVKMTLLQWFASPDRLPWDQEHKISD